MSTGVIRCALSSVLEDEGFGLNTPRLKLAKEIARKILDLRVDQQETFDVFSATLTAKMKALMPKKGSEKTLTAQKRKLWQRFHAERLSSFRILWTNFFLALDIGSTDYLVTEYVNEKVMEMEVKATYEVEYEKVVVEDLTEDEQNALRYAAGYVPKKLIEKFRKPTYTHPHKQDYLARLELLGEGLTSKELEKENTTFLEYTKKWVTSVDRGGLFKITDEGYRLFYEIEQNVGKCLNKITVGDTEGKAEIMAAIADDCDVQFHWSLIAVEIDDNVAKELLMQIVGLWLNIRGFSLAGAFVEQYKQITKTSTKRSTALRKQLKRKKLDINKED